MKKVLLGMLALSAVALGANPGVFDPTPDAISTASVPVRVLAEVVPVASSLVITDEAGTVLDELLMDHKIVSGAGQTGDSVVAKNFKALVTDANGAVVEAQAGAVEVKLSTDKTTLKKVGGNEIMISTLRLLGSTLDGVAGGETVTGNMVAGVYKGTVTSTIPSIQGETAVSGVYDNKASETAMPTLTVTYTAQ